MKCLLKGSIRHRESLAESAPHHRQCQEKKLRISNARIFGVIEKHGLAWECNLHYMCEFTSAEMRVEVPSADGKEETSAGAAHCSSQDLGWVFPCHFLTSKTFLVVSYVF